MEPRETSLLANKHLKEWLAFALLFAVIGTYVTYALNESHDRVEARERERLTHQCEVVSLNLARQFAAIDAALVGITKEVPEWHKRKDGPSLAVQHLRALNNAMPGVMTFLIFDVDGTVRASDRQELVGENFSDREYFKAVRQAPDAGKLYVRQPFTTSRGNFTINLIRMIPDSNGGFGGMVVAGLDAEEFKVLLQSVLYRPDVKAALVHGDGVPYLMAPLSKAIGGIDIVQPGGFFQQHMQSGEVVDVFRGRVSAVEDERLVALQTIQPKSLNMDRPMVVAVSRPWDAIFVRWNKDVQNESLLFVLVAGSSAAFLILRQRRRILGRQSSHSFGSREGEKLSGFERE